MHSCWRCRFSRVGLRPQGQMPTHLGGSSKTWTTNARRQRHNLATLDSARTRAASLLNASMPQIASISAMVLASCEIADALGTRCALCADMSRQRLCPFLARYLLPASITLGVAASAQAQDNANAPRTPAVPNVAPNTPSGIFGGRKQLAISRSNRSAQETAEARTCVANFRDYPSQNSRSSSARSSKSFGVRASGTSVRG